MEQIIKSENGFEVAGLFQYNYIIVMPKIVSERFLMLGRYRGIGFTIAHRIDRQIFKLYEKFGRKFKMRGMLFDFVGNKMQLQNETIVDLVADNKWAFGEDNSLTGEVKFLEKYKLHMIQDCRSVNIKVEKNIVHPRYAVKVLIDHKHLQEVEEYLKSLPTEQQIMEHVHNGLKEAVNNAVIDTKEVVI